MQAIDFRLEDHGRVVHDPLVRTWWYDTGFVGRCPVCHGWIRFTTLRMEALDGQQAGQYPRLPDNWAAIAQFAAAIIRHLL